MQRNAEIDYLRAYAVLFVVVLHMALELGLSYGVKFNFPAWLSLDSGVDIFFAISGYVICEAYHRLRVRHSGFDLYVNFILRRFKRLWPASTFWLSVCLMLSALGGNFPAFNDVVMKFFAGLIYLFNFYEFDKQSNLGFFWSLSVEWQFYIFMPILMCLERRFRVAILVLLLMVLIFYRPGGTGWWMFRFDGILCGMLAWELSQLYQLNITFSSDRFLSFFITLFLLIEILLVEKIVSGLYFYKTLQSILSGALVYLAVQERRYVCCFGLRPFFAWVGLRSYSIYLCHLPVLISISSLKVSGHWGMGFWESCFIACGLIALLSEVSYRYIESFFGNFELNAAVSKTI